MKREKQSKEKARKNKKWDEVHGEYEVEVSEESGGRKIGDCPG